MKLSSIPRTSVVRWSPCSDKSNYIACGSISGALEADFSVKSKLDVFKIIQDSDEGVLEGSVETDERFNDITWSNGIEGYNSGLIAGAMSDNSVLVWDADKILKKDEESNPLLCKMEDHKSQIKGIDFSPLESHNLATGSEDAVVIQWDLNKPTKPQKLELQNKFKDNHKVISNLKWNPIHKTILGTTSRDGTCVMWNIDKRSPIIKVENPQKKLRYSCLTWNPETMTQLAIGSEDNSSPYIEIWELKTAYEPTRVLKGHTKGILSLSWCPFDSNLLLSTGKDGRTIVWNPNTGEMLGELPRSKGWVFNVQWSHKPSIFSTASFEENIGVYSLQEYSISSIEDNDPFSGKSGAKKNFKTAPKWMQRRVSSAFGFGSKLVRVDNKSKKIKLYNMKQDDEFILKVKELENCLKTEENYQEFCETKITEGKLDVWKVMHVLFNEKNQKGELLKMLGFQKKSEEEEIKIPMKQIVEEFETEKEEKGEVIDEEKVEDMIQNALVNTDFKTAVKICLATKKYADALIFAERGGNELKQWTFNEFMKTKRSQMMELNYNLLNSNINEVIESIPLEKWKKTLAILLNYVKNKKQLKEYVKKLGEKVEDVNDKLVCFLVSGSFENVVDIWLNEYEKGEEEIKEKMLTFVTKIMMYTEFSMDESQDKVIFSEKVQDIIFKFSNLLTEYGELESTLRFLNVVPTLNDSFIRYRVYNALDKPFGNRPKCPFAKSTHKTVPKKKITPIKTQPKEFKNEKPFIPEPGPRSDSLKRKIQPPTPIQNNTFWRPKDSPTPFMPGPTPDSKKINQPPIDQPPVNMNYNFVPRENKLPQPQVPIRKKDVIPQEESESSEESEEDSDSPKEEVSNKLTFKVPEEVPEDIKNLIESIQKIFNIVYDESTDSKKSGKREIYMLFLALQRKKVRPEIVVLLKDLLEKVMKKDKAKIILSVRNISKKFFKETKSYIKPLKFLFLAYLKK